MNGAGGLILLYHRVTRLETDPQLLAVTPENFAAQIGVLKEMSRPMRLGEMAAAAPRGEDLTGAVAVTFDDGYADNLLEAEPILRAAEIPASVFVASGGTDSCGEFFWDELDRLFLQPNKLPGKLTISAREWTYTADLNDAAEYARRDWNQYRHWNVTDIDNPTPRHRVYRELCALIHKSTIADRKAALAQIQQWAHLGEAGRTTHRMMSAAQLREIEEGGVIELGGHTINHPLLAVEADEVQEREIARGKAALESNIGRSVRAFSYPFGGRRDYTGATVAAVKSAGLEYACSNFNGVVDGETDPFQLPRILVRDWSADEFRARMSRWIFAQA